MSQRSHNYACHHDSFDWLLVRSAFVIVSLARIIAQQSFTNSHNSRRIWKGTYGSRGCSRSWSFDCGSSVLEGLDRLFKITWIYNLNYRDKAATFYYFFTNLVWSRPTIWQRSNNCFTVKKLTFKTWLLKTWKSQLYNKYVWSHLTLCMILILINEFVLCLSKNKCFTISAFLLSHLYVKAKNSK